MLAQQQQAAQQQARAQSHAAQMVQRAGAVTYARMPGQMPGQMPGMRPGLPGMPPVQMQMQGMHARPGLGMTTYQQRAPLGYGTNSAYQQQAQKRGRQNEPRQEWASSVVAPPPPLAPPLTEFLETLASSAVAAAMPTEMRNGGAGWPRANVPETYTYDEAHLNPNGTLGAWVAPDAPEAPEEEEEVKAEEAAADAEGGSGTAEA